MGAEFSGTIMALPDLTASKFHCIESIYVAFSPLTPTDGVYYNFKKGNNVHFNICSKYNVSEFVAATRW